MPETTAVTAVDREALRAQFSEMDFVLVVDASGSMSEKDMPDGKSRWVSVQETVVAIANEIEEIDEDGLGIVIFGGDNITAKDGVTAKNVKEIFAERRPSGTTPLAEALTEAIKLAGKSDKKDMIIVFTDGAPNDKEKAAKVIIDAANGIEKDEDLTILFIQVGYDAEATAYLTKLDDSLTGAKFDIVDVKTMKEADAFPSILDLIYAAING